jgi:cell division protein FtsB
LREWRGGFTALEQRIDELSKENDELRAKIRRLEQQQDLDDGFTDFLQAKDSGSPE